MRHILVVDDDLHTRLAIGIWLKQCGFRVAITDGGESGLAENMPQRALPLRARRRTFRERASTGCHAAFAAFVDPEAAAEITGTSRQTGKTRQPHYNCD
jgi:CheY-like chemotaxis protein